MRTTLAANVFSLLLTLAPAPPAQAEMMTVIVQDARTRAVTLGNPLTERPDDLAFSRSRQQVFGLGQVGDAVVIKQWSTRGGGSSEWKLPPGYRPASILFIHHNDLCLVAHDGSLFCEVVFDPATNSVKSSPIAGAPRAFDEQLDPKRHQAIRSLMRKLEFYPSPHVGQHVADYRTLLDYFYVNARDLRDERIASTSDLSVFVFADDAGLASIARRGPDGKYSVSSVESLLRSAVVPAKDAANPRYFCYTLASTVSEKEVSLGLEAGIGKGIRHIVVSLAWSGRGWKVQSKQDGLLARNVEEFK